MSTTTQFIFTATDQTTLCTSLPDTVIITVTGGPLSVSGSDDTICEGESVTLNSNASGGSGSYTYSWTSTPVGFTSTSANPSVSPTTTTTYHVTVNDGYNIVSDDITITVNPLPSPSISGTTTICNGDNTTLTASGGSSYLWSTGNSTAAITVSPTSNTSYTVTVTSDEGCSATTSQTVTVNPLPTPSISGTTTICNGDNTTLTASGGSDYHWSTGPTTAAITVSPTSTTSYTVTVTNAEGCSATTSQMVTVNPLPTPSISGTTTICNGESTTLTASGGSDYHWSTGPTTAAITVNPTSTTSYTVTVTNAAGCSATTSQTVTVNPLPTPSISGTTTICNGDNTTLIASGGSTYLWSNSSNSPSITVSPTATMSYSVTVTSAAGCSATTSQTVTVNPLPTPSISGNTTICNGGSTTLTASGGSTYLWSTTSTNASITVNPTSTTTYTVTVTNTLGCSANTSQTVTVNPLPTASISGTTTICNGESTTLTANGGSTYHWSTGSITSAITVSPTSTTPYTVTVTNTAGCSSITSQTVTVNSLPTIIAGSNSPICAGEDLNLTETGNDATVWSWSGPNGFSSTSQNPTIVSAGTDYDGLYSVTGTIAATGCSATDNVDVTVNALPIVYGGADQTIANGTSTTINDNTISPAGSYFYTWTPSGSLVNSSVFHPATTNLTTTTQFIFTATDQTTLCTSLPDTVVITITGGPLSVSVSNDTICYGESTGLNAIASGGSGTYTYQWESNPSGFTSTFANPIVSPLATTTYSVTVSDGFNTVSDQLIVTVNPLPSVTANSNDINNSICFTDSIILYGSGNADSYTWDNGVTDSVIFSPSATQTYTVTGTTNEGCSYTDTITITVNPLPTVGANSDDIDNIICYGDTITLTGSGADSYTWDNGVIDGTGFVPTTTQTYTVTGTTSAGCSDTDTIQITVNPLPNIDSLVTTDVTVCSLPYNGSITTYASGGGGGFTYSFNNGSFISQNYLDTLGAGIVTVVVIDANGCQNSDSATIGTNNGLNIDSVYVTDVLCNGDSSGIITIDAPGANQFSIDNGVTFDTSYTFTGLPAGNYSIMVLDLGNCQAFDAVTINEPTAIQLTSNVTNYACGQLGEASVQATGGIPPYNYLWSTGDTTSAITGLQPDTFFVTVTDNHGCVESLTVIVGSNGGTAQIQTASTDVSCNGFADGTATAVMTNGSAPYTYQWNMGDSTSTVTGLSAGTYYVTIVDAAGCAGNDTVIINEPPALDITSLPTDVSCYSFNDGSIFISVTGGTPGYSYLWNTGDNTAAISSLGSGYYSVTVTDSNSCSTSVDSIYIKEPDSLYIYLSNATNPFCYNGNDGAISVYGMGGTQPYSYTWNTGDSTETLNNLTAGTYFLTLTDINACHDTAEFTLTNPEGMTISADYGVDSIVYQGYINLNVTGGTQPYTYEWSNAATNQNLSGLSSGNYLVTITDFNGCAQTDSFNIEIPLIIPTIITPNGDSYNDTWRITNIESYKDVHIEIYNRWGDIIFTFDGTGLEYTDIANQWDGTYNGKKLPFTSYVYIITLNDDKEAYSGTVTIKQ